MALADNWINFIRIHGGESGARDMFEKVMGELLKAENPDKEVHVIKAAPGDGGIDVYVQQDNGVDIYQCKFFMDKMTAGKWQQVKKSFSKAMEPKGIKVLRWFLCMPMEFRQQDISSIIKFKEERASYGIEIVFIDGDQIINRMQKSDPQLIDKYFSPMPAYLNKAFTKFEGVGLTGIPEIRREKIDKAGNYIVSKEHHIKQIDIVAFEMPHLRGQWGNDLIKCLKNGTNIRMLVMNPNKIFMDAKADEDGVTPDQKKRAMKCLAEWVKYANKESDNGKIVLKYYDGMTKPFYMRVDDCLYTGPYSGGEKSLNETTYEHRVGTEEYSKGSNQFEVWWSKASES